MRAGLLCVRPCYHDAMRRTTIAAPEDVLDALRAMAAERHVSDGRRYPGGAEREGGTLHTHPTRSAAPPGPRKRGVGAHGYREARGVRNGPSHAHGASARHRDNRSTRRSIGMTLTTRRPGGSSSMPESHW